MSVHDVIEPGRHAAEELENKGNLGAIGREKGDQPAFPRGCGGSVNSERGVYALHRH